MKFWTMSQVEDHLRARHQTEWLKYAHNYTTIYAFWKCNICAKRMQRVQASISRHLKWHKISSIRKYEQVYGKPEFKTGSGIVELENPQTSSGLGTQGTQIKQECDPNDFIDTATNVSTLINDQSVSMKVEQFLDPASDELPKIVDSWVVVMCQTGGEERVKRCNRQQRIYVFCLVLGKTLCEAIFIMSHSGKQ